MYAKDRHFLANSAPEAGNVSNREKSGTSRNFPLMCKIMAETAPTRPILSPPAAPFLSTAKEIGERTPPKTHGFWISFRRLPPRSDSSEMLNRRISLRAAAFALKCAGAQLCISRLCCSPPRGEGFQREGTRTSRSLWPVGGMGFLRERGNRNPLSLKPFFGHFLSAKKVTHRRHPPAGWREPRKKGPPLGGPFFVLVHSVMIRRITRSVSRMPCAASTPTWWMVSSTSVPRMPSPGRKLSPFRYMS